ncbi:hypothetical protein ACFTSD_17545 [Nocardiaceae bacterium NPDC056970]
MQLPPQYVAAGIYTATTAALLSANYTPTRAAIWLPIWAVATGALVYSGAREKRRTAAGA